MAAPDVAGDLATTASASTAAPVALNPGGIQIAGPSQDVFILENEIEDSGLNGITLGSFSVMDAKGQDTGITLGVLTVEQDPCSGTVTLQPGGPPSSAPNGSTLVAGGLLTNIQIHSNIIRNTGLCGIGPAGFFDLQEALEIISIENLAIGSNEITNALQGSLAAVSQKNFIPGYGAICLPDVSNLIVSDNTITNYGATPGLEVCGIYLLHGEMIEISRNQVLETRDWGAAAEVPGGTGFRAGICIVLAAPPSFSTASTLIKATEIYEPGLPALRIEHNTVRVPVPQALVVEGFGPFSIVNNHFACGGSLTSGGNSLAESVLILNLGAAVESSGAAASFSQLYANNSGALQTSSQLAESSGAIIFANNACLLEAAALRQSAFSNVLILTRDSLIFSGNHCWIDAPSSAATVDALLLAGRCKLQIIACRNHPAFPYLLPA